MYCCNSSKLLADVVCDGYNMELLLTTMAYPPTFMSNSKSVIIFLGMKALIVSPVLYIVTLVGLLNQFNTLRASSSTISYLLTMQILKVWGGSSAI